MSIYAHSARKGTAADAEMFYFSDEDDGLGNELNGTSGSGDVTVEKSASQISGARSHGPPEQGTTHSAAENGSNGANPQARVLRRKSTHKKRQALDTPPSTIDVPQKQKRKRKSKYIAASWKDEMDHIRAQRATAEEHQSQQEQLLLQQRRQQLQMEQILLEQEQQEQMEQIAQTMWHEQYSMVQPQQWGPASSSYSVQGTTPAMLGMHDSTIDMHTPYSAGAASTLYNVGNQYPYHPALFEQQTGSLQPSMHTGAYGMVPQLPPWEADLVDDQGVNMFTPADFTIPNDWVPQSPYDLPNGTAPFR